MFEKKSFWKKVLLGAKRKEEKCFQKLRGLYRAPRSDNSATTLLLYGKGLSRKFVEARAGRHNSRGVQVRTPDAGLRSQGGNRAFLYPGRGYSSAPGDTVGSSAMAPDACSKERGGPGCRDGLTCRERPALVDMDGGFD